jgi:hypothetical protein
VSPGCDDIFISDTNNNRIREVNSITGDISTIVGTGATSSSGDGGPAASATVDKPGGVYMDSSGNLYIADMNGDQIREVTNCSLCTVPAPTATPTPMPIHNCSSSITSATLYIAADDDAQIYINGNLVGTLPSCVMGFTEAYSCPTTYTINPSWLNTNSCNLIATTDMDVNASDMGESYDLVVMFSDGSIEEISSDPTKWNIGYYFDGYGGGAPPVDSNGNQWYQINYLSCPAWPSACANSSQAYSGWYKLVYQIPCGIGCGNVPWIGPDANGTNCYFDPGPGNDSSWYSYRQLFSLCSSVSCPPSSCSSTTPTNTSTATPTNTATNTATQTATNTPTNTATKTTTNTPTQKYSDSFTDEYSYQYQHGYIHQYAD